MVRGEVYCWHCHCVKSCHYVTLLFVVGSEISTSETAGFVAHVTIRQCGPRAAAPCKPSAPPQSDS